MSDETVAEGRGGEFSTSLPQMDDADDAMTALLDLLGRRHTLSILYVFARDGGPWRFGELREQLEVPPNTLTNRLKELVGGGFLQRDSYDEIPPRVEYTATPAADDLRPAFAHIYQWTQEHSLAEADAAN